MTAKVEETKKLQQNFKKDLRKKNSALEKSNNQVARLEKENREITQKLQTTIEHGESLRKRADILEETANTLTKTNNKLNEEIKAHKELAEGYVKQLIPEHGGNDDVEAMENEIKELREMNNTLEAEMNHIKVKISDNESS